MQTTCTTASIMNMYAYCAAIVCQLQRKTDACCKLLIVASNSMLLVGCSVIVGYELMVNRGFFLTCVVIS